MIAIIKSPRRAGQATEEALKKKLFEHPLFPKLKEKYPDRDYEYQFALMWDWWRNNKRKQPTSIAAFENWLRRAPVDLGIVQARQERQKKEAEREAMVKNNVNPDRPIDPEGQAKLEALRQKWSKKGSILERK